MNKAIIANKVPIEEEQRVKLRELFTSPGFGTLREVLAAQCALRQVTFMDASMYGNDNASDQAKDAILAASKYSAALDILDALEKKEDEWFRISLEQRR